DAERRRVVPDVRPLLGGRERAAREDDPGPDEGTDDAGRGGDAGPHRGDRRRQERGREGRATGTAARPAPQGAVALGLRRGGELDGVPRPTGDRAAAGRGDRPGAAGTG